MVEGDFGHEDNVGGAFGPLPAGSVQRMTLGSGAWHSEQNASKDEGMRFIQIWILPDTPSLPPAVEQRVFTQEDRTNRLLKVIGPEGGDVVKVHQDAAVYAGLLEANKKVRHDFRSGFGGYLFVVNGSLVRPELDEGGAAKIQGEEVSVATTPPPPQITDLLDALKASVEAEKKKRKKAPKPKAAS